MVHYCINNYYDFQLIAHVVRRASVQRAVKDLAVRVCLVASVRVATTAGVVMHVPVRKAPVARSELQCQ